MKNKYYIFSIFSSKLQDYPYYPFPAKTISQGIVHYLRFIENRGSVCEEPQLHIIGTCRIPPNSTDLEYIEPYVIPKNVEIKDNRFSRLVVLGFYHLDKFQRYLNTLYERINYARKHYRKQDSKD
ncbi:hypothetical protein [Dipodfec virus RodF1_47]|uniref:Uncharacterized protein n=1 Tax=Dipodfec virus RodF1_47 TaxID=2929298 RepID=A0A976N3D4_9VIRU|nr:hypothetical protein [Dipodfec virus RodF1_47]